MSKQLKVIHPHAAGIDIGAEKIFVSVAGQEVKVFATYTASLLEAAQYLRSQHIQTVAMEATGVYWIPLYEILEQAGLEVCLVNGIHVKQVPGRKSDMKDCQWIQELHSHGLLPASFIPKEAIRKWRSYVRLRDDHIRMAATHVNHIQRALDLMNIKLHQVIAQIQGASGLRIIRAILSGEREAEKLADLCEKQILKTKRQQVILSLEGNYQEEHLFALKQALACWEFYQTQILECDKTAVLMGICLISWHYKLIYFEYFSLLLPF